MVGGTDRGAERTGSLPVASPKIFGVGIGARIRSSSSTAPTTMPRTNAGIFFMRAAAVSPCNASPPDTRRPLRSRG